LADYFIFLTKKGKIMNINIEKNIVEFKPESAEEAKQLESLWKTIVDCARFNKKMVPMGEFVPKHEEKNIARFVIEGEAETNTEGIPEAYADTDSKYICMTCNKYVDLKKGDRIPLCCGKLMETLD
jgi:hypothetical protein